MEFLLSHSTSRIRTVMTNSLVQTVAVGRLGRGRSRLASNGTKAKSLITSHQQRRPNKSATMSSSLKQHSTTTSMDFTHSAPSLISKAECDSAAYPSMTNLRALFVASAIPMVGFGAMDNIVMIQAGQYIDSTLGVSLGLATMTAAAAGQVVSDVSGVVFGGTLERVLSRMGAIPAPDLTNAQRQLSICRNVSMAGAVVGVIIGCALGACTLLLVDLDARNRIERAHQLREIVTDMISDKDLGGLSAETSTIYLAAKGKFTLDEEGTGNKFRTSMEFLDDAQCDFVKECGARRETIVSSSGNIVYVPVAVDNDLIAVVEFRHNRTNDATTFSEEDILQAKTIAKHLAIFMTRIAG
ncbi:hypothetical protein MPSEU_000276000 [Mayamaea pseudoterrestris]|nr:hypothetical protein MPSEU_000276000 [Mayamaea pseudoterrestris]